MCILSDRDIRERMERGELGIEPFTAKNVTPNGVDLTVKEVLLRGSGTKVTEGVAKIPPGAGFLLSTREFVKMPEDVAGQLWIRSSYARRGLVAAFGKVECGFQGELTIGGLNAGAEAVDMPIGDRFCQLAFEKMESRPERSYVERSGNYQGQRGITFAKNQPT